MPTGLSKCRNCRRSPVRRRSGSGGVAAEPRCVTVNPKEVVFPRGEKVTDAAVGILRFCTATERCRHGEAAATAGSERAVSGMNRNRAGLCRRTAAGC